MWKRVIFRSSVEFLYSSIRPFPRQKFETLMTGKIGEKRLVCEWIWVISASGVMENFKCYTPRRPMKRSSPGKYLTQTYANFGAEQALLILTWQAVHRTGYCCWIPRPVHLLISLVGEGCHKEARAVLFLVLCAAIRNVAGTTCRR